MPSYTSEIASGSTDGRMIKVVATATPGTTLHTAVTGTDDMDEVWIWAVNSDTSSRKLTIELGGTTAPDDLIEYTVPAEDGLHLIVPGIRLQNAAVVKAFAATTNVVLCAVSVNRIHKNVS